MKMKMVEWKVPVKGDFSKKKINPISRTKRGHTTLHLKY